MQPDNEADDLRALLQEEYGAPPLDEQFSADLLARLRDEAAPAKVLQAARATPHMSSPVICLSIAAVAALVIAVIWISQLGTPAKNREVAQPAKTDVRRKELSDLSEQVEEGARDDRVDDMSVTRRSLSLNSESESLPLRESLSSASEGKQYSESRTQSRESLVPGESKPSELSVLDVFPNEWPNISAAVAHAGLLYVVDSGQLYEVSPRDGARRRVGNDDWQNTVALGAVGEFLYLVCDDRLFEVNPKTGVRRGLGKPEWAGTKAIVTVGEKLYIACGGHLYRVDPSDGSYEVLHSSNDRPNNPRQSKP